MTGLSWYSGEYSLALCSGFQTDSVASLTQQDSLEELKRTRQSIRRIKSINGEHVPLVLVGSKCDLEDEREVDTATGEKLAAEWHCQYLETSAVS